MHTQWKYEMCVLLHTHREHRQTTASPNHLGSQHRIKDTRVTSERASMSEVGLETYRAMHTSRSDLVTWCLCPSLHLALITEESAGTMYTSRSFPSWMSWTYTHSHSHTHTTSKSSDQLLLAVLRALILYMHEYCIYYNTQFSLREKPSKTDST